MRIGKVDHHQQFVDRSAVFTICWWHLAVDKVTTCVSFALTGWCVTSQRGQPVVKLVTYCQVRAAFLSSSASRSAEEINGGSHWNAPCPSLALAGWSYYLSPLCTFLPPPPHPSPPNPPSSPTSPAQPLPSPILSVFSHFLRRSISGAVASVGIIAFERRSRVHDIVWSATLAESHGGRPQHTGRGKTDHMLRVCSMWWEWGWDIGGCVCLGSISLWYWKRPFPTLVLMLLFMAGCRAATHCLLLDQTRMHRFCISCQEGMVSLGFSQPWPVLVSRYCCTI